MLRDSIRAHVAIALEEEKRDPDGREARLKAAVDRLLVDAGCAHSELSADQVRQIFESDIELNAQGLQRMADPAGQEEGRIVPGLSACLKTPNAARGRAPL